MNAIREPLEAAILEALAGHDLLVEPGDHPDRYPTLRVSYEGSGQWYAALHGRAGPSYSGAEYEVFIPVELRWDQVDWSAALSIAADGTEMIDEGVRRAVAADAQQRHIAANLGRWANSVLHTLRERGVFAGAL